MITCVCDICGYSHNSIWKHTKLYEINMDNKRKYKRKIHICERCLNQIGEKSFDQWRDTK